MGDSRIKIEYPSLPLCQIDFVPIKRDAMYDDGSIPRIDTGISTLVCNDWMYVVVLPGTEALSDRDSLYILYFRYRNRKHPTDRTGKISFWIVHRVRLVSEIV